ncbi:MAG: sigma-70 family RNA polymerase sigma factor [Clostridia bacterium]|nr:sigma-70 family RNA polymerase sigma factor [Clostridia bacterium]
MTDREKAYEKELVIKAKSGNDKAFEEIIKIYEQKICSTIFYMVKNKDIVEDIAQEVFIKVYRNIDKFNEQSSLYTWIYRITMNACFDEMKKEKKITYLSNFVETEEGEQEVEFEDPSQNVDEIISAKLDREELIKAIKKLPDEQRAIIVLRDIRGFTYWEIADMLKIKLGTVKSKISRARISLKNELEKAGFEYDISDNDVII